MPTFLGMISYHVQAFDKKDGSESTIKISANSKEEAIAIVSEMGYITGEVGISYSETDLKSGTKIPTHSEKSLHPFREMADILHPNRFNEKPLQSDYYGLEFVSSVLFATAIVSYISGGFATIAGLIILIASAQEGSNASTSSPITIIISGIALVVNGIWLHGFSAFLNAIRDMAINSYEIKDLLKK